MKFCTYCGAAIDEGVAFCPNCGAKVKETADTEFTSTASESVDSVFGSSTSYTDTRDHTPSKGAAVISFLFPIIGLILWLVWNENKPGKAHSVLKGLLACLGFNIPIVGIILYFVWKEEKPDFAKVSLYSGLISIAVGVVGGIVFGVLYAALIFASLGMESDPYALAQLVRYGLFLI